MTTKETNRDRQTGELEVIKSIFGADVEDLRPKNTSWKPLDIRILLLPLKGSSGEDFAYAKTKLHIICSHKYPKVPPKIFLEDSKGISDTLIDELLQQLQLQAVNLKGEVMIFDLAHSVQAFLHKHNKPPKGSFYDEMLQERQKREQEQITIQLQKQTLERQNLLEEVEKRKEIFKSEAKRREPRRSISETNNTTRRHNTSSESSENASPYYMVSTHMNNPNKCLEHCNSETLYFHKSGRQIKRGCCLGHSQKGCIVYSGIDLNTGQLLYITEWNIKYSQVEAKCLANCYWFGDQKCNGHKIDEFINSIEKNVAYLSQLYHKNLIQYQCVLCMKHKEGIKIWLAQDFVLGTSLSSISSTLGWCTEGSRMVANGTLEALIFLHNKGISYSYLLDSTVFMDNSGIIRCTDFSLVPHLIELVTGVKSNNGDLPALGSLIESLMPTLPYEMRDFVDKCNSYRTLSASELSDHQFLRTTIPLEDKKYKTDNIKRKIVTHHIPSSKKDTLGVPSTTSTAVVPFLVSPSRLRTEFELLKYLGKGAFGDVLKARNILDNREYAIKRIPLPSSRSRQLYKKMTREVELLSRLNHENVVRYFNSWIENVTTAELEEMDPNHSDDSKSPQESFKPLSPCPPPVESDDDESSSDNMWKYRNIDDSDTDDGIEFINSNGEIAVYDEEIDNHSEDDTRPSNSPRPNIQVMYIQMEFCEKCTLRLAIDDNLYRDNDRLWRFFREIAEGLSHIHQLGIIHRDLKPVNIFIDAHDQIKIGDFGLATTSFLALQVNEQQSVNTTLRIDGGTSTGTGKVGTTLYVAPELTGNASKSIYNQKVDMYTLGIILFEMSNPPFETGMERIKTIISLRNPAINIPENMLKNLQCERNVKIIRWLLNHDSLQRPTAEELLASELLPPPQLEASELKEMLRNALENPQSKIYKHLVARCLQQECNDQALELTYHLGLVNVNPVIDYIKTIVLNLFRKHGGTEVNTPLLNTFSKNTYSNNPIRLMTNSGSVVTLPSDLHVLFAKHVATNNIKLMRRYSVDRVYRDQRGLNFHPKQYYECAFDIITPKPGNQLVDAELISIAYEITAEIPKLKEKNISIRINHTSLLRAILLFCSVPKTEYRTLFENYMDYIDGRITKFQFQSSVTAILLNSKSSATLLIDLLLTDIQIGGRKSCSDCSALKPILRGKGESSSLAKGAIRELELTIQLAQSLGVTCPFRLFAGLPISYDRISSGGIVWQMVTDPRLNRGNKSSILAYGERYDTMLLEFQKQAHSSNANIPICGGVSGAGFSFILDKLVSAVGTELKEVRRSIDVVVCASGSRPPIKDVTYILRLLWSAGIRSGVVEANGPEEAKDYAKDLGAVHVILLDECGELRVRSWDNERFQESHVTRTELVSYIQKLLTTDSINLHNDWYIRVSGGGNSSSGGGSQSSSYIQQGPSTSNAISIRNNFINQMPNFEVRFLTHEKMTANVRKRSENQVTLQMQSTLTKFGRKEHFIVMVVDLTSPIINAIIGAINPRELSQKETDKEIGYVIERFPKQKRYISEIIDDVYDELSIDKNKPIMALYSIADSCFRIII